MPIRRPRGPKPVLRHVAFLEAADAPNTSARDRESALAAFLTLRLFDEWMASGPLLADPEFPAHAAARRAVTDLAQDVEMQTALQRILDAVTMLHDADAQPVLPRIYALGGLLEHRGSSAMACDVYGTISRFVDGRAHLDLAFDALMKQGLCRRNAGELDLAERSYEAAGMLAARARDRGRVLLARIGEAKVNWLRGNLPAADAALDKIAEEAATIGEQRVQALALHDRAGVARHRSDLPRAVRLAFESFKLTVDDIDRERVLNDLGNFLGLTGAFETARHALTAMAQSARQQESRWTAQMNLMDLATREGNEIRFEQHRRQLEKEPLPVRHAVSFQRDAGRGLAAFGRLGDAGPYLQRALELATKAGLHQAEFEITGMLADLEALKAKEEANRPAPAAAPADIALGLEELLRESALVG